MYVSIEKKKKDNRRGQETALSESTQLACELSKLNSSPCIIIVFFMKSLALTPLCMVCSSVSTNAMCGYACPPVINCPLILRAMGWHMVCGEWHLCALSHALRPYVTGMGSNVAIIQTRTSGALFVVLRYISLRVFL